MSELAYPTRNGLAIHPMELELPESHLNPESTRNWNHHHMQWTRKQYGKQFLYFAFRSIETRQLHMLVDQHDWVHQEYDPPVMPTIQQALKEIERAKDAGEMLNLRQPAKAKGTYSREPITDEVLRKCIASYDSLRRARC